ncbi:MAG: T9SS type A sorting domain-containing protein [bacterium]
MRTRNRSHAEPASSFVILLAASLIATTLFATPAFAELFAVTDAGQVFASSNGGVTWSTRGVVTEPEIAGLTPGLSQGTLFLIGEAGDVYTSGNAGVSWTVVGNAGASDCADLCIDRGGDLLALTRTGDFMRSASNGATWTVVSNAGFSDGAALAVGRAIAATDSLFAITASGDVAVSVDGASWTVVGNTGYTPVVDLVWADGVLRAITDAGEILVSNNSGASWSAVGAISQVGMRALTVAEGDLLAITKEGDVAQSTNGVTWSWVGTVNQVFVVALAPSAPEFTTSVGGPSNPGPGVTVRAFPNPFTKEIRFALSGVDAQSKLDVAIFDTAGRRVAQVHSGALGNQEGELFWRPRTVAAGVYFLRVNSDRFSDTQRLVLIR